MDGLPTDAVYDELRRLGGDPAKLPERARYVVLVDTAQGLIDNGGLRYFFEADFPGQPRYRVFSEAFRRIGAPAAGERIDAALRFFPFPDPERKQVERLRFIDGLPADHAFHELDDAACGDHKVWEALSEFIQRNESHLLSRSADESQS